MKIHIKGQPDDLIKRCDTCKHCIFEDILSEEQRKIKVLYREMPKNHIHRTVIEQLCGRHYDSVCPMKYAAMRATVDDRTAIQMAVVKNYVWDMGKRYKMKIEYSLAMQKWTMQQDLGRKEKESRAERYNEIWKIGIRNIIIDDKPLENQLFTTDFIYEIIMTSAEDYEKWLKMLDKLKQEHEERDKGIS